MYYSPYAHHHSTGAGGCNSASASSLAEAKAALIAMAAEADELHRPWAVRLLTPWRMLAPQYAVAARKQLAALKGGDRLKLLRAFVHDWALLRHGDQTAERLRIERDWLEVASRDADMKWKRKIIIGLETLMSTRRSTREPNPRSIVSSLGRCVTRFDPTNPTESDR